MGDAENIEAFYEANLSNPAWVVICVCVCVCVCVSE